MNDELEYFADLALGLLNDTLSMEEKEITRGLIINDETFLEILKTEITIKKAMEPLKESISPALSKRVYLDITTNVEQLMFQKVFGLVLDLTLPEILQPLSKLFQGSVLVNE